MSVEATNGVKDSTHISVYQILPMVSEEHNLNFSKQKVNKEILGTGWEIT
jgi:hypothetical protein